MGFLLPGYGIPFDCPLWLGWFLAVVWEFGGLEGGEDETWTYKNWPNCVGRLFVKSSWLTHWRTVA